MSSYTWLRPDPIWLITSTSLLIVNRNSTHLVPLEAVNRLFIQVVFAHQFLCFAAESNFWWRHHLWLLRFSIHQIPHLFLWRHHSSCFIPIGPTGESLISGCLYLTPACARKKDRIDFSELLEYSRFSFLCKDVFIWERNHWIGKIRRCFECFPRHLINIIYHVYKFSAAYPCSLSQGPLSWERQQTKEKTQRKCRGGKVRRKIEQIA